MSFGDLIGKVITAPIKIATMPLVTTVDFLMSDGDPVKAVTDSIEKQVKDIVD